MRRHQADVAGRRRLGGNCYTARMSPRPQRVLIVSASIGSGHVAAGRALDEEFLEAGCETLHVDLLDYTTAPFRRLYRQAYFDLVRTAPDLVDWLGRRLDRAPPRIMKRNLRLRSRLVRMISYHLPRTIASYRPDLLVNTHFLPAEVLSASRRRPPAQQAVVVTDFAAHRLWMQPHVARYYVATDEVRAHLLSLGTPGGAVRVTGIPVSSRFGNLGEKGKLREELGYRPDRDLLLVMAGGMSAATLEAVVDGLRALRLDLRAVIICGRSTGLLRRTQSQLEGHSGPVTMEAQGFSDDIARLMGAADLVVGKPGGLTTSEALAAGIPFAVVDPYPIQEEANANYLLEQGAGMRIAPLSTLALKLSRFFGDSERRSAMSRAARQLGRPHAARDVVADLLGNPPMAGGGR